jgi:hypothetical protein
MAHAHPGKAQKSEDENRIRSKQRAASRLYPGDEFAPRFTTQQSSDATGQWQPDEK